MTSLLRESEDLAWQDARPAAQGEQPQATAGRVRLLLVDDDEQFREAVSGELADRGFEVVALSDGRALLEFFEAGKDADLIVLDWKLPTGAGIDLLPRLRGRGIKLPVLFLTGVPAAAYESMALDGGALDFVDKTRGTGILAKRIRLILEAGKRPPELAQDEVVENGRLTLRPKVSRAYWDGKDIGLTVTEFNIVKLMATAPGDHVSYRTIYDCVHRAGFVAGSGENGYRTNVRSSVKRIRNKFRAVDAEFGEIENFPAFGYRWRRP
jgi:two-component system response regulator ChvI